MEGWEELPFLDWEGQFSRGGAEAEARLGLQIKALLSNLCSSTTKLMFWALYRIRLHCGRPWFDPWVGKIPWRRESLPTLVFLPGEFHGLYSPRGHKESDMKWSSLHFTSLTSVSKNLVGREQCYWLVLLRNHQHPAFVPASDTDEHQLTLGSIKSSVHEVRGGNIAIRKQQKFFWNPSLTWNDVLVWPLVIMLLQMDSNWYKAIFQMLTWTYLFTNVC